MQSRTVSYSLISMTQKSRNFWNSFFTKFSWWQNMIWIDKRLFTAFIYASWYYLAYAGLNYSLLAIEDACNTHIPLRKPKNTWFLKFIRPQGLWIQNCRPFLLLFYLNHLIFKEFLLKYNLREMSLSHIISLCTSCSHREFSLLRIFESSTEQDC